MWTAQCNVLMLSWRLHMGRNKLPNYVPEIFLNGKSTCHLVTRNSKHLWNLSTCVTREEKNVLLALPASPVLLQLCVDLSASTIANPHTVCTETGRKSDVCMQARNLQPCNIGTRLPCQLYPDGGCTYPKESNLKWWVFGLAKIQAWIGPNSLFKLSYFKLMSFHCISFSYCALLLWKDVTHSTLSTHWQKGVTCEVLTLGFMYIHQP